MDEEPIEKVAVLARENLDIIPGDKRTEKAKRTIVISNFPTEILSRILQHADYDVVILDMAPSLDVLHVSALMASDWVIIPTRLDAMAVDGVNEVLLTWCYAHGAVHQKPFFEGYHPCVSYSLFEIRRVSQVASTAVRGRIRSA